MIVLTPKNWKSFQHYKDRSPAWIKLHKGLLQDYDFHCLPVASRALAPMLWLLASEYEDGEIRGTLDALAFKLHMTRGDFADALSPLVEKGFFDASEPLAECKQEACPEKERETEKETEREKIAAANAASADAPRDYRSELFGRGLRSLASMTGKGPDACRSFVGKCLKAAGDDAVTVLGLIEDAERNQVVDPSAWIAARLKGPDHAKPKSSVIQAADNLRAKLASFDGRASREDGLRGREGASPPRLLSNG